MASNTFIPAEHLDSAVSSRSTSEHYIALHQGETAAQLYRVGLDGSFAIALDETQTPAAQLKFVDWSERWVLLQSELDNRGWRISLSDGEMLSFDPTPPTGPPPSQMDYCAPRLTLTSHGLLATAGGAEALAFQSLQPETNHWSVLGLPVSQVETVDIAERDGTYLLQGVVETFCPGPVADGAATSLDGPSTQLVRPSSGVALQLGGSFSSAVSIRSGGECIAYQTPAGTHIVDMVSAHETVLSDESGIVWWEYPLGP